MVVIEGAMESFFLHVQTETRTLVPSLEVMVVKQGSAADSADDCLMDLVALIANHFSAEVCSLYAMRSGEML